MLFTAFCTMLGLFFFVAFQFLSYRTSNNLALSGKPWKLRKEINFLANMRRFGFPMLSSWRGKNIGARMCNIKVQVRDRAQPSGDSTRDSSWSWSTERESGAWVQSGILWQWFRSGWQVWKFIIFQVVSSSSRSDNCSLKPKSTKRIDEKWKIVQKNIKKKKDEESFGQKVNQVYHTSGHLAIGEDCKSKPDDFDSAMVYDATSARDPTFYRWRSILDFGHSSHTRYI